MTRWKISRGALFLLMGFLVLIVVILILPDVDLLDTAFHRGTAPVLEHSRATSAPSLLTVRILTPVMFSREAAESQLERSSLSHLTLQSLPILHQSLRC
jgi:hypothetical protein